MHTNHRRKNAHRSKYRNRYYAWFHPQSLKPHRRQKSRDRRAEEREALAHDRWDDLSRRYPRSILWEL